MIVGRALAVGAGEVELVDEGGAVGDGGALELDGLAAYALLAIVGEIDVCLRVVLVGRGGGLGGW